MLGKLIWNYALLCEENMMLKVYKHLWTYIGPLVMSRNRELIDFNENTYVKICLVVLYRWLRWVSLKKKCLAAVPVMTIKKDLDSYKEVHLKNWVRIWSK